MANSSNGPLSPATGMAHHAARWPGNWPPGCPLCWLSILRARGRCVPRCPDALLVFLAPPSWPELVRRLTGRGTEPPEVIERRLAAARVELAAEHEFDVTLINTSVGDVRRQLVALAMALAGR